MLEIALLLVLAAAAALTDETGSAAKLVLTVVSIAALLAGGAFVFQRPLGLAIMKRGVEAGMNRNLLASLPDGLHAGLCGSGAPLPDPNRAGPCVFVIAGGHMYIVDAGDGSARKLGLMGLPAAFVDSIFLTHFHSDHIGGLGEMMLQRWAGGGNAQPVEVYGPQGVESVVEGFNAAYKLDSGYRVAHHGAATVPPSGAGGVARPFTLAADSSQVIFDRDGLKITAFAVTHPPVFPAVGYRFDYRGRSIVISGDTAPSESLANAAKGVDVLFHEGLQPSMVSILHDAAARHGRKILAKIMGDIPSYHTTPEDAARIADRAGVRRLVIYHVIPALPFGYLQGAYLGGAEKLFHGPISVGKDGMMLSLPAGSAAISLRELL
ncbi:MAG: MBL fold metallo-hydrolase [Acidobacteriia bacterium]|nr:MBL fold metallo-hydrolase [Terriglobia bacterium]